eukprot:166017-Ditylum_brightwellii.AAC.1
MEDKMMRIAGEGLPSLSSVADGAIGMIGRPSEDNTKGCSVEASKETIKECKQITFISYFAWAFLLSW